MLLDVIEQRHICISLRIFDPEDLATGWEVKAIIENPDIFEDFFSKYPLQQIECFDDYYLYFLSLKMQNFSTIVPKLLQEDHKVKITALSKAAGSAVQALGPGSAIKYINGNIEEIFDTDVSKHDIHFVTLDFIAKYNSGKKKRLFYICVKIMAICSLIAMKLSRLSLSKLLNYSKHYFLQENLMILAHIGLKKCLIYGNILC